MLKQIGIIHVVTVLCFSGSTSGTTSTLHSSMPAYMYALVLHSREIGVIRLQRSSVSIQMLIKEHSIKGSFSATLKQEQCMNLPLDVEVT